MCDLKPTQRNVLYCLIWKLMPYKLKLGHNATETAKNICCAKGEGTGDYSKVTRWLKKFHLGCKDFNVRVRSSKPKPMDSDAMLQAIEANLTRNT